MARHEAAAIQRLRDAAQKMPMFNEAFENVLADLLLTGDIIHAIQAGASLMLAAEAIEEAAKQGVANLRAALAEVMAETGATEVALPHHTVALVEPKPRPFVSDATLLPAELLKPQPPKPDMDAIKAALRRGPVAGVSLTNSAPHVRVSSRKEQAA